MKTKPRPAIFKSCSLGYYIYSPHKNGQYLHKDGSWDCLCGKDNFFDSVKEAAAFLESQGFQDAEFEAYWKAQNIKMSPAVLEEAMKEVARNAWVAAREGR